jgi:small basic protein
MDVIAQEITNQAIRAIHEKMNKLQIQETRTFVEPPFDTKVTIFGFDFNCVVAIGYLLYI